MANVRIKYVVDNAELQKMQKELDEVKQKVGEVEGGFKDQNKQIKATGKGLGDLKGIIAGIGIAALALEGAKAFAQLTAEIIKTRKEVAILTKLSGAALDLITAKVKATSQVFDKDFNEVLRAANTLSKEFGISLPAAIDKINQGFEHGADVNGEYLDTLKEYSTQIKSAGIDADQFIQIIQKSVQEGIFSDKGIDAIKEAQLRLRELTPATKQALDQIGISSKKVASDLATGQKTIFEVIQDVSRRLGELPAASAKVGTAIADIFGGPGEDAGLRYLKLLGDIDGKLKDTGSEAKLYTDQQAGLIETQEKLNLQLVKFSDNWKDFSVFFKDVFNTTAAATLKLLNQFIDSFKTLDEKQADFEQRVKTGTIETLQTELEQLYAKQLLLLTSLDEAPKKLAQGLYGALPTEALVKSQDQVQEELNQTNKEIDLLTAKILELKEKEKPPPDDPTGKNNIFQRIVYSIDKMVAKSPELTAFEQSLIEFTKKVFGGNIDADVANFEKGIDAEIRAIAKRNEKAKELNDEYVEDQRQHQEDVINASIDFASQLSATIGELTYNNLQVRLDALEIEKEQSLKLAGDNAYAREKIDREYTARNLALRRKQAEAAKTDAQFQAFINTAVAVTKALPNLALAAIIAAAGIAQQIAIASRPLPKFGRGVINLRGRKHSQGGELAEIEGGESVMTRKETTDYLPTLLAMRNNQIDPEILNEFVKYGRNPIIVNSGLDELAQAFRSRPEKNIYADERGFTGFILDKNRQVMIQQSKYKM